MKADYKRLVCLCFDVGEREKEESKKILRFEAKWLDEKTSFSGCGVWVELAQRQ